MKNITRIKLFISSPKDVEAEREAVEEIIKEINDYEGNNQLFQVIIYKWETGFTTDWGEYQPHINEELKDTDIFLGILWNRFGSPTSRYLSGTEEEFNDVCRLSKQGKRIELCFYRCKRNAGFNPNNNEDLLQRQRINDFFERNRQIFSYTNYVEIDDFKIRLRKDLLTKISSLLQKKDKLFKELEEIYKSFQTNGIKKLYTPELNSARNRDKINFLEKEEGDIYLLAHSGNSYLHTSEEGNPGRFFNFLKIRLKSKPFKAKILLLNPYSLEARKMFFAEKFDFYQNDISSIKNAKILEQGKNFLRFNKCIQGIDEIKDELGDDRNRLEVRISNVATDGTILMSNRRLFYEPYISSRFLNRIEKGLNLFEIQVQNLLNNKQCSSVFNKQRCNFCSDKNLCAENLYKTIAEQYHILWATSISLAEYRGHIPKYIIDFCETQPDLFHKQIVQLHDSWFAFDPVIGCNGNCIYCFLGPQGWKNSSPQIREISVESENSYLDNAYQSLKEYRFFNSNGYNAKLLGDIPVSIGNKTDMLATTNKQKLLYLLQLHEQNHNNRPLVLITKQKIDLKTIDIIKKYTFDVYIFCSISFLPRQFEPNVPSYKARLGNAKNVKEKILTENISNIHLIHYWRPIIKFMKEGIPNILTQLKPIFDCSICVGLKINKEILKSIKNDNWELYNYILNKTSGIENSTEIFEPSFDEISFSALKIDYPVFKHTSCALSFVQGKVDYNGTMWREDFCMSCPAEQKERCKSFKENWDVNEYESLLIEHLQSKYKLRSDCIEIIDTTITQEKINYLTHLVGKPIFAESIRFSLVWPSSNQIYFMNKYSEKDSFEVIKTEYPTLIQQLERLRGITGFVSILGNDNRVNVFNRYDHVFRVVRLLKWYINDLKGIDKKKCAFIGLFHDINRLPFAHNLEKEITFSQADTLIDYMKLFNVELEDHYYKDFNSFFSKKINGSIESRITFLIDAISGFIEDPLFAFCTLGLNFKTLPSDVLSILGFDNTDILEKHIAKLNDLYMKKEINSFIKEFNDIVFIYAKAFINNKKCDDYKIISDDDFWDIRAKIKKELMIDLIFPINNEMVSKGKELANDIGKTYISYLKEKNENPNNCLFKMTDKDLLKAAKSVGIIADEEFYYPNLNLGSHNLNISAINEYK